MTDATSPRDSDPSLGAPSTEDDGLFGFPTAGPQTTSGRPTGPIETRRPAARVRLQSPSFPYLLTALVVLVAMLIAPPFLQQVSYYMARGRQQAARDELKELTPTKFSATSRLVAQAISQSVIYINTRGHVTGGPDRLSADRIAGQGSGVIVDTDGYIVTNFHVIAAAQQIMVHLSDGRVEQAEVVGVDADTDLAVLKISAGTLSAAEWGDSSTLKTGDPVWAVGSPFGLDNSVSFGIISAKGRYDIGATRYQNLLQTDAAVNPGNSGGALVNSQGQLVGINTAILGTTYRGISFAIPSNMARDVFERLKYDGQYARGWLGVRMDKISDEQLAELGSDGVLVVDVLEGSPAAQAGVRAGDIIVRWNNEVVDGSRGLSFLVAATDPDSSADMEVIRDGHGRTLSVAVGRKP